MPSGSELQEIPRSPFSIGRRGGKISSATQKCSERADQQQKSH